MQVQNFKECLKTYCIPKLTNESILISKLDMSDGIFWNHMKDINLSTDTFDSDDKLFDRFCFELDDMIAEDRSTGDALYYPIPPSEPMRLVYFQSGSKLDDSNTSRILNVTEQFRFDCAISHEVVSGFLEEFIILLPLPKASSILSLNMFPWVDVELQHSESDQKVTIPADKDSAHRIVSTKVSQCSAATTAMKQKLPTVEKGLEASIVSKRIGKKYKHTEDIDHKIPMRFVGSLRALRDSYVHMVMRHLKHIERLNRAIDGPHMCRRR